MFNKKETISIYKKECKRLERERNELLERLMISDNKLTNITLDKNTNLTSLGLENNKLSQL